MTLTFDLEIYFSIADGDTSSVRDIYSPRSKRFYHGVGSILDVFPRTQFVLI